MKTCIIQILIASVALSACTISYKTTAEEVEYFKKLCANNEGLKHFHRQGLNVSIATCNNNARFTINKLNIPAHISTSPFNPTKGTTNQ